MFLSSGEAWLSSVPHQSVVSIPLVPAGLRQGGGVLLGAEVCTPSVWREPRSDTFSHRLLWQAERTGPPEAMPDSGRGGPQTSAV